MDRDTVIALAREAGLEYSCQDGWTSPTPENKYAEWVEQEPLERFAALVAAHEREECAKLCEEMELRSADGQLGTYIAGWSDGTDDCAAAIRSRT